MAVDGHGRAMTNKMPARHIFQDAPFSEEQLDLMFTVFEQVIRDLGLSQGTEASRDLVANAVLKCAERDIFDPFELRKCACEVLLTARTLRKD